MSESLPVTFTALAAQHIRKAEIWWRKNRTLRLMLFVKSWNVESPDRVEREREVCDVGRHSVVECIVRCKRDSILNCLNAESPKSLEVILHGFELFG